MSDETDRMNLKDVVRAFYNRIWNSYDTSVIPALLHEDFTFRGSLGPASEGHEGFTRYMHQIHAALAKYHCEICELVAEGNTVAARMLFSGIHRGELLGQPPTQRKVEWAAVAIFKFDGAQIKDLWVLGDVAGLLQQLSASGHSALG